MQLKRKIIDERDGSGTITLVPEQPEDMVCSCDTAATMQII
jgi:hypothetical protein